MAGMRRIARVAKGAGLVIATVLALLAADGLAGAVYRTSTAASVQVTAARSGAAEQAVVVFPGYIMSGEQLSRAFAPFLPAGDAMVVADYAERGVDMDGLYREVTAALEVIRPARVRVYGASMGGLCAKQFLDRYARDGSPYGPAVLVLDTAPDSAARIKRPGWVFGLSSWYRGGPLTSAGWALLNQLGAQPTPEDGADLRVVDEARRYSTWVGMPALTSQADFLGAAPALRDGELTGRAERVVYLHGRDPADDPLVWVADSMVQWRRAFPGLVEVIVDGRAGAWHIPLIERPGETMTALLSA
jgi:hypothetical protein